MHLSCCQGLGWWWGEGFVSFHTALPPSPTDPPFTAFCSSLKLFGFDHCYILCTTPPHPLDGPRNIEPTITGAICRDNIKTPWLQAVMAQKGWVW